MKVFQRTFGVLSIAVLILTIGCVPIFTQYDVKSDEFSRKKPSILGAITFRIPDAVFVRENDSVSIKLNAKFHQHEKRLYISMTINNASQTDYLFDPQKLQFTHDTIVLTPEGVTANRAYVPASRAFFLPQKKDLEIKATFVGDIFKQHIDSFTIHFGGLYSVQQSDSIDIGNVLFTCCS